MTNTTRSRSGGAGSKVFETPSGTVVTLTTEEYRLALLALVDFEASGEAGAGAGWDEMEAATAFVRDGEAKLALLRRRVRPLGPLLSPLAQRVDTTELLVARYWFRAAACTAADTPETEAP